MTKQYYEPEEFDFLAYGDGRLEENVSKKEALENWLARHPDAGARLKRDRDINGAMRAAFDHVLREPAPDRLLAALEEPVSSKNILARAGIAASVAAAVVAGWIMPESPAHEERMAFNEAAILDAAGGQDLAPVSAAPRSADAPDLSRFGLSPVAAENLSVQNVRIRRVLYQGGDGAPLEVLATRLTPDPRAGIEVSRASSGYVAAWSDNNVAYRVQAEFPPQELRRIAQSLRSQERKSGTLFAGEGGAARGSPPPPVAGGAIVADAPQAAPPGNADAASRKILNENGAPAGGAPPNEEPRN